VARPIKEVIVSRRIGGTERHGWLRVIVWCKREKNGFVKIVYVVVVVCFFLLHASYTRNRGACVTPQKCDMMEDSLTGRASKGNLDG
jgi:hypothetical protein